MFDTPAGKDRRGSTQLGKNINLARKGRYSENNHHSGHSKHLADSTKEKIRRSIKKIYRMKNE
jgi:hypothetical protein